MKTSEIENLSKDFLKKENDRKARIHLDKMKSILARTFPVNLENQTNSKDRIGMGSGKGFHG